MSSHWIVFTLRGWIAFLAFMNLGTAARCFIDRQFVHTKFFGVDGVKEEETQEAIRKEDAVIERLFGFWSVINGIIFLHCAVFIQDAKIMGIAACALALYVSFFAVEIFAFETIVLNGATLYPFAMTGLSLVWLIVSYTFGQRSDLYDDFDENDILRKSFPFKNVIKKVK